MRRHTEEELLRRLRCLLDDPESAVWTDAFLVRALRRGLTEYCRRAPLQKRVTPVMPDEDGVYRWPSDMLAYFHGINIAGEEILPATPRRLAGHPELIKDSGEEDDGAEKYIPYDENANAYLQPPDTGDVGKYRKRPVTRFVVDRGNHTYAPFPAGPVPEEIRYISCPTEWGLLESQRIGRDEEPPELTFDGKFGTVCGIEGGRRVFSDLDYGVPVTMAVGPASGYLKYTRQDPVGWTLDDPRGVVFYAAHLAFRQETDRKNENMAALCMQLFERVVNMNTHRAVRAARTQPNGVYY